MGQRIVAIQTELLVELFINGATHHFKVTQGLPADAELVFVLPRPDGVTEFTFESAEWGEVKEGELTPRIDITVERVNG